jgi:hypothetical protein
LLFGSYEKIINDEILTIMAWNPTALARSTKFRQVSLESGIVQPDSGETGQNPTILARLRPESSESDYSSLATVAEIWCKWPDSDNSGRNSTASVDGFWCPDPKI